MKTKHELTETIGNKAANLVALESMLIDYSETLDELKTLTVTVPQICPLTHQDISAHLTQCAPGWIRLWEQFKIAQGTESHHLTIDASEILTQLRKLIKETFVQYLYAVDELSDFLTTIDPDALLMVRSTGKEDAVDIANPGGNESVASVRQDPLSISTAIGTVVASYFSDKSLLQRLSGQQDILEEAFMPVLIQKMISEVAEHVDNPVVSGVMYTSPAGIQIQMAPGHGEYIVNSKGPFDTIYVSREQVVHAEINEKKQRLVPAESGLTYQANSPVLATSLSIDRLVATDIASVGRCVRDYYEMPMDIEFVYDPGTHSLCLVQARPIPPGSSKLIPPSSIAPTQVMFVKEHGDMIKAQVITPAGNAVQIITQPEEILIVDNISDALDTYLHQQDNVFKAVVIAEKAPQTSHEVAQFNSMGIPVLQVSVAQLKSLEERMQKPDVVLIIDPQRKSMIDWTKNIKHHATAQEEIHAAGLIEEGLFQSSLSIYESLLPVFKEHPFLIKPVPEDLSSSMGDLIAKSNSEDPNTSEQAFNALMQRLFRDLTMNIVEPVSLYDSFEQLKATKDPEALKKIVSQLYHLARNPSETIEMQTLYKLVFQHAVIDAGEISCAMSNPAMTQQEWLDTVARLELLVTAPFNPALQTSSIHQLLEIRLSREKASTVAGFKALTDEQQQYFISFFQLGKLIVNDDMRVKWTKFTLAACKKSPNYQALSTLMYFLHENGIAADWLNSYFDPKKSIASMGVECSKIIDELRPLELPSIRNKIDEWEKCLPEWSNPKRFDHLYSDYINDVTAMIERLDTTNDTHPLSQKTILKVVQDLTEMMDKTIKSLKGSPEYREHSALLVERFYKLLVPYKDMMTKWVSKLPIETFTQKTDMLVSINQCFTNLRSNSNTQQLNPSGRVSIPAVAVDSAAEFARQFNRVIGDITLEDLFSLMHQNTLIATTRLGQDSQIKIKSLPALLQSLHDELSGNNADSSNPKILPAKPALMNISLSYPLIYLEYNLPLRGHSAKFLIEFNQETMEVIFHGKFFGHNRGGRMEAIANFARMEGDLFSVNTLREPKYNEQSNILEWTWGIELKKMMNFLPHLNAIIKDYADITFECNDFNHYINKIMLRHPDAKLPSLPDHLPDTLQRFINELPVGQQQPVSIPCLITPIESKMLLMRSSQDEKSIKLVYMVTADTSKFSCPEEKSVVFIIDYNLLNDSLDLYVKISGPAPVGGQGRIVIPQIEHFLLSADLEGSLINAHVISAPHFNEKNGAIEWCWRFGKDKNMTDLARLLAGSFNYDAYFLEGSNIGTLIYTHAEIATSPDMYVHIVQCVKDFFEQGKHIRGTIGGSSLAAQEWETLDNLKSSFPAKLLPAAEALHLFDKPEQVKKIIQAQKSIGEGLKALKESDDPTLSKEPGSSPSRFVWFRFW